MAAMAMTETNFVFESQLGKELRCRVGAPGQWSPWSPVALPSPQPHKIKSLRASAAVLTAPEGYSAAFGELVAAASQGSTMKLCWETFVPDGRALRPFTQT